MCPAKLLHVWCVFPGASLSTVSPRCLSLVPHASAKNEKSSTEVKARPCSTQANCFVRKPFGPTHFSQFGHSMALFQNLLCFCVVVLLCVCWFRFSCVLGAWDRTSRDHHYPEAPFQGTAILPDRPQMFSLSWGLGRSWPTQSARLEWGWDQRQQVRRRRLHGEGG